MISRNYIQPSELNNNNLQIVIENISEGLYRSSEQGKLLCCNAAFAKIFGYKDELEIKESIQNIGDDLYINTKDRELLSNRLKIEGKIYGYEILANHKSGKSIWIRINVIQQKIPDTDIIYYEGSVIDISNEKIKEIELQKLTALSTSILNHSVDIISILGKSGDITYESPAITRILGYQQGERYGQSAFKMVHPEDLDTIIQLFQDLIYKPDQITQARFRYRHKNGDYIYLEAEAINKLNDENINGIILNTRDISQRIKIEHELQTKNEELLGNKQKIDRLIYSLSHEVRSPISAIKGIVREIYSEDKKVTIDEYAGMIEECSEKLDKFIHDLLNFSILEKTKPLFENIYLNHLIQEIIEDVKDSKINENLSFKVNMKDENIIFTDSKRLQIILKAIIQNAVIFYDKNKNEHLVELNIFRKANYLSIQVKDNGIGFNQELSGKIFDMFYRGTHLSKGTGFGLYLAKEAANQIKTKIVAESLEGMGSEFSIILPYSNNN